MPDFLISEEGRPKQSLCLFRSAKIADKHDLPGFRVQGKILQMKIRPSHQRETQTRGMQFAQYAERPGRDFPVYIRNTPAASCGGGYDIVFTQSN